MFENMKVCSINRKGIWLVMLCGVFAISCGNDRTSDIAKEDSQTEISSLIPIGIALYSFNRFPFSQTLDMAKQAGTDLVEGFFFHNLGEEYDNKLMLDLDDQELREMKNMIDQKGLRMSSIYAGGKNEEEWNRFFEIGQIFGLEFLVCEPEPEHWDFLDSLGQVTGIQLALHEHAQGLSRFWHPDSVLMALKGRANFGACGDLGHWVRSGLDPVECLKKLEGHLISIHAKDLDEFGNLEANDVNIGAGVIDYEAVMRELNRQGFDGPVFIECEHNWENNQGDVKEGIDYILKIQEEIYSSK